MDDAQFQAWLDQHGGEVGRKDNEKDVDGPLDPNTGLPSKVMSVDSTTITARDGATITLRRNPGPYVGNTTVYTITATTPPKETAAKPAQPKGDIQTIGGRVMEYNPATGRYDIDHGPSTAPPTSAGTVVERTDGTYIIKPDGTATKVQGVPPPDAPKGTLTEREDGTYLVSPDGKTATRVTGLPPKTQDKYTQVTQDKDTGRWFGLTRAGTWEQMQGGPGAPQTGQRPAGPNLPEIIVGHSQEALRKYGDELRRQVAIGPPHGMTAAEAANRWKEAVETAGIARDEAVILQRESESNLNASVNLANSRLSSASSGFNTALQVVNNLNSSLPKGSRLGGEAFAAILGLNLANAQRAGAYDNIVPGSQPSMQGRNVADVAQGATATFDQQVERLTRPPAPPAMPAPGVTTPPAILSAPTPPMVPGTPSPVGDTGAPPLPADTQRILDNVRPIPGGTPIDSAPQAQGQPDFAVLTAMGRTPPPVAPLNPAPIIGPGPMEPALLHTQAASRPFWQMSNQEIEEYRAAGVPEDVIRSSGRMVA